jgi:hypothetical protein
MLCWYYRPDKQIYAAAHTPACVTGSILFVCCVHLLQSPFPGIASRKAIFAYDYLAFSWYCSHAMAPSHMAWMRQAPEVHITRLHEISTVCVQLRLQGARRVAEIRRQEKEVQRKARKCTTREQLVENKLLEYDKLSLVSRAESIGYWIGNTFCYSLLTQGPFCAGILLQVRLPFLVQVATLLC